MNKPTHRISNVTESSFVLHFSLNDTLKYCNFVPDIENRISQCVKSLIGRCVDQNYYISTIDQHQLNWVKENPAPSLNYAHFVLNALHVRSDASDNIFSVKIQIDSTKHDYNKDIIDGVRAGDFILIPRAVIVYGEEGYFYYLKPFLENDPDRECPAGGVKLIGFDFYYLPKTVKMSVSSVEEAQQIIDEFRKLDKVAPKEESFLPGGWGTNKTPDIYYPEYQPTYNGVRLHVDIEPTTGNDQGSVVN